MHTFNLYNGMYGLFRIFVKIITKAHIGELIIVSISYDGLVFSPISFEIVLDWAIRNRRNEVKNTRQPLTPYNDPKLPLYD